MISPAVLHEIEAIRLEIIRRSREGWTGQIALDFKDGRVKVGNVKNPRSQKQHDRVD